MCFWEGRVGWGPIVWQGFMVVVRGCGPEVVDVLLACCQGLVWGWGHVCQVGVG